MKKYKLLTFFLVLLIISCQSTGQHSTPPAVVRPTVSISQVDFSAEKQTAGENWWDDAVFYQVFVRSFKDSDGDGVGDIRGLIDGLDYLNDGDAATSDDLGVTALWLMPIMKSPSYHGYDVVDYYSINPDYGTDRDMDDLLEACHERGIKVIIDLVMNHTGSGNPYFMESSNNINSPKRDWYIWSETKPVITGPWGQGVWHNSTNGYYYGVFTSGMPDLNYNNPLVTEEMYSIIEYWLLDRDVDGFRLDAIRYLKEDGDILADAPSNHQWFQEFYDFYKDVKPDAFTVGEIWSTTEEVLSYTGDQVDMGFEFDLASEIITAARRGSSKSLYEKLYQITEVFPAGQYATFLANHDQPRVLTQMGGDLESMKLAASIQLSLPGVPFIYYGEEIGMMGGKPDENIRRPMQWDDQTGFTSGRPWESMGTNWKEVNVQVETQDQSSLLSHYRDMLSLRNSNPVLSQGSYYPVSASKNSILAYYRYLDGQIALVIHNLSTRTADRISLSLDNGPFSGDLMESGEVVMGKDNYTKAEIGVSGGFSEWVPYSQLEPKSTTIILFN